MEYRQGQCESIIGETVRLIVSHEWRNADNGWGERPGRSSDAWSTAEVSDLLSTLSTDLNIVSNVQLPAILATANTFLAERQNDDGGWGVEGRKSDATGTELAMSALAKSGDHKYIQNLKRATDWMFSNRNSQDAGWSLQGGMAVSSIFCTCFACLALNGLSDELKTVTVRESLLRLAEARLLGAANQDGGWGHIANTSSSSTALATAHAVYTLNTVFNRAGKLLESSIIWLKQHQNPNGSWGEEEGGTVEATAWSVIALLTFEKKPATRYIHKAIDYLLDGYVPNKGWSNAKGQNAAVWATVFALKALATYLIQCRAVSGKKISLKERGQSIFSHSKVRAVVIAAQVAAISILGLQFVGVLKSVLGPYSDLLNAVAAIFTLLSLIWVAIPGLNKR